AGRSRAPPTGLPRRRIRRRDCRDTAPLALPAARTECRPSRTPTEFEVNPISNWPVNGGKRSASRSTVNASWRRPMMCRRGEAGNAKASSSTGPADYTVECIDTRVAPEAPIDYWVDQVRANHGSLQLHFEDPPVFRGGKLVQKNATHQLVDFWSDALHYVRTDADVNADDQQGSLLFIARHGVLEI